MAAMRTSTVATHDRLVAQRRTLRIAWLTLFVFFGLFLALSSWVVWNIRQWYLTATDVQTAILVVRGSDESIVWQPAGRTIFQGVRDQQPLSEGEAVRTLPNAGYGQVASLRLFEGSQLDLWAGTELRLTTLRTTRWHSGTLQVALEQTNGYVRYDVRGDQPFQNVFFTVTVGDAQVKLLPGGSYSINLYPPERRVIRSDGRPALIADVAVRSGSAIVTGVVGQPVRLAAGQRIEVDPAGIPGLPVPHAGSLSAMVVFPVFLRLSITIPRAPMTRPYRVQPPGRFQVHRVSPCLNAVSSGWRKSVALLTIRWFAPSKTGVPQRGSTGLVGRPKALSPVSASRLVYRGPGLMCPSFVPWSFHCGRGWIINHYRQRVIAALSAR